MKKISECIRLRGGFVATVLSTLLAMTCGLATSASAQCELAWQPGPGAAGPRGMVLAMTVAPNGDLIAGGEFTVADDAVVNNIARFDGSRWLPLGVGVSGTIRAVAVRSNGDVIAGGTGVSATGGSASLLVRWDGASWSPLGTGITGHVMHVAVLPNGDVVAGTSLGAVWYWDGFSLSQMASPGFSGLHSLVTTPTGGLVASGFAALPATPNIVEWNGAMWVPLPGVPANLNGRVVALSNGDVLITGGGLNRWSAGTVTPLPLPGFPALVYCEANNGDLVAAGHPGSAQAGTLVARMSNGSWVNLPIGSANGYSPRIMVDASDAVIVGGESDQPSTTASITRYASGAWEVVTGVEPVKINAVERLANGDVVVGGVFESIGGVAAANIAIWNGSTYAPLGLGTNGEVTAIGAASDGSVLVGGEFTNAGGGLALRFARWSGTSWAPVGSGLDAAVVEIAEDISGDVLAYTPNLGRIRVFDGTSWSANVPTFGMPLSLAKMPDGSVAALGIFFTTCVMRYSNGSYVPVPSGSVTMGFRGTTTPDGDFVVSGIMGGSIGMFRLTGSGAVALPWPLASSATALGCLPNGDMVAGGNFNGSGIAKFDGTTWLAIGDGLEGGFATDLAFSDEHGLFVCGTFDRAAGQPSVTFSVAQTNCPASTTSFFSGCTGSAGTMQLTADTQPWIGGTLSATASGFPAQSLGLNVIGMPAVPAPLPMGAANCTLQVAPFQASLLVPSAGTAQSSIAIPNDPNLAGQVFRTQVVGLELDASGSIQQLTSTNSLQMTIGAL